MADSIVKRFVIDGKTFAIPENVLEGVKVNGTALVIADKIVDILITTGTADGNINVNGVDVAVKGLAALAYKANVSEDELADALKAKIASIATIDGKVTTLEGQVETLNGTGAGSVSKAITDAFNDFATKVTDDGVVNSYKELIDWAAAHGADATEMAASISKLEAINAGIGGTDEPATVKAAIKAAVDAVVADLEISNYYNKTEADTLLAGKVDKVEGKGLSANDFTNELKTKLEGIEAGSKAITYAYDTATQTLTLNGLTAQA